jgi:hypothetical protein
MNKQELKTVANPGWLGRLRLQKPKKNEKIGIPYKDWHHLAIIDDYVFTYVWDTRAIIDVYPLSACTPFNTTKITDSGRPLLVTAETTSRAAKIAKELCKKYPELPIVVSGTKLDIKVVREAAEDALLNVDIDTFMILNDTQSFLVDDKANMLDELYMYEKVPTIQPNKAKYADNNSYTGIAKYFAILAHCAVLSDISKHINRQ